MYRILIIEDDPAVRGDADRELRSLGHEVVTVDASAAMTLLVEQDFDVVVAGLEPAPGDASEVNARGIPQEIICLPRPLSTEVVIEAVAKLENREVIRQTLERARQKLPAELEPDSTIIGNSAAMRLVHERVTAVAVTDAPVLITGESGTARSWSHRRSTPGARVATDRWSS